MSQMQGAFLPGFFVMLEIYNYVRESIQAQCNFIANFLVIYCKFGGFKLIMSFII